MKKTVLKIFQVDKIKMVGRSKMHIKYKEKPRQSIMKNTDLQHPYTPKKKLDHLVRKLNIHTDQRLGDRINYLLQTPLVDYRYPKHISTNVESPDKKTNKKSLYKDS